MKLLCRLFMLTAALTVAMAASATRIDTEGTDFAASQNDSVNRAVATIVGVNINQVIDELVSLNVPVDRVTVGKYLAAYFAGADLGFTHKDAGSYIDGIISTSSPQGIPDSLSIESQKGYLDSMATSPGAVVTPSGLVFIVMTEGEGTMPTIDDKVDVQYIARLSDGTVFDDTTGAPVTFNVNNVVPGFSEGLQLMKPGGTYRLVFPASIGFGTEGIPGIVPGNAALDFTVTLVGVHK